ncbi:MAG: trypsin-like serine protease [Myxococcota bacterium]
MSDQPTGPQAMGGAPNHRFLPGEPGSILSVPVPIDEEILVVGRTPPPSTEERAGDSERVGTVTEIMDTRLPPWQMLCRIRVTFPFQTVLATGWFVGPHAVVTAGHALFYHPYGGAAESITVIPGKNGGIEPFGAIYSRRFEVHPQWRSSSDPHYDLGCIFIDSPRGSELGCFSVWAPKTEELRHFRINMAGYPMEEQAGPLLDQGLLFHHVNEVEYLAEHRIYYHLKSKFGQSGGPVWLYRDASDLPIVVGVHAEGADSDRPGPSGFFDSSTRITEDKFDVIAQWSKWSPPSDPVG